MYWRIYVKPIRLALNAQLVSIVTVVEYYYRVSGVSWVEPWLWTHLAGPTHEPSVPVTVVMPMLHWGEVGAL